MKKLFLMMGVIPLIVFADKETVNGIEWTYTVSDGIATVGTGAGVGLWIPDLAIPKGTVGAIAIPSVLGGCPVTRIDVGAFYGCNKLTAVTIPVGVTRIGEHAFDGCCALTNVTVEGAIMEVGFRAFAECVSISCLCFKEAPERIDKTAFWNCNKSAIMIDDLYIPGETGYVEDTYRGMGVRNVVIGEGIESIGASAFEGCWCVTNIVFPDTLRSIYSRAFKGCIGLTEITLPERVTDVDYEVFSDCSNLVSVTFLSNGDHLRVSDPFVGCVNLTQLNIRVLSSMLSNTFRFSDGLCNPLTVKVLEPCDELPDCWAISCSFMKELNLPDGLVRIGESAIADCRVLESVRLPMSLQTIDDSAFDACMQLRKLVLPNGLRSIGNYAFSSCQQLETPIHIPNSVTNVGYLAFWPRDVSDLLFDSGNENFAVEDGVLYKLDHGVKVEVTMVSRSLRGEYVVPLTVKRIAPYAFNECEDITSIVLPEGLEEIREFAFSGCKGLVSLNIPSTVSDLSGSAIRSVPFEVVHIDPSKPIYYKDGQFICRKIDDEHVEVVSVDRSCEGNLELPENVVRIGDYAFYGCDRLASVAMPESVISIGDYCFYGCEALQTVFIPAGTIGNDAFAFCRKLMSIEIGNNVTDIGSYAFMYCSNVVSVVIPKSVSAIGSHAFQDCKSLSRAVILGGELGSYVFNGCDALEDVHMGLEVTKIPSPTFLIIGKLEKVSDRTCGLSASFGNIAA